MGKKSKKTGRETKWTVEVLPVSADGTRTIWINDGDTFVERVELDEKTSRIAKPYLDDIKQKLTVDKDGYLTKIGHGSLHRFIAQNQEHFDTVYEQAIQKWGTSKLVVGHLDGKCRNPNLRNLEYIPLALNIFMQMNHPGKSGKKWRGRIQFQGE
jgi:hypothetical protein